MTEQEADKETGSLRLQSTTGGYDKTVPIAGNFYVNPAPAESVDVEFENVPTKDSYSLSYIAADGTPTRIVDKAPFGTLNDNALPPESGGTPPLTPAP